MKADENVSSKDKGKFCFLTLKESHLSYCMLDFTSAINDLSIWMDVEPTTSTVIEVTIATLIICSISASGKPSPCISSRLYLIMPKSI